MQRQCSTAETPCTAPTPPPTLARLFEDAGNTLTPTKEGFACGHEPVHSSKSGACVAINTANGVWYCRSCLTGGGLVRAYMSLTGASSQDALDQLTARGLNTYFLRENDSGSSPTAERGSLLNALNTLNTFIEWPRMPDEAYWGVLGDFCKRLEPHTEADPVALLVQGLTMAGTLVGRSPHAMTEATRHGLNTFAVLVGETAIARKGTSYDHLGGLLTSLLSTLQSSSGLGSGEGVIAAIQDAVIRRGVEVHPGVSDKRLLIEEQEFSSVLKVASREGNILSEILRKAWDGRTLRNQVKHAPLTATDPHVSILGHITVAQLRRLLTEDDQSNGFGNRFLWVVVRRARLLPHGGRTDMDWQDLATTLEKRIVAAQSFGGLRRADAANAAWEGVYAALTTPPPGLVGALIARAAPHAVRLSCIYAVLDGSRTIRLEHMLAALAVVGYSMASVQYVFGQSTGDVAADMILAALREQPTGVTKTELYADVFQKNTKASDIVRALTVLASHQQIQATQHKTGSGRPTTVYTLHTSSDYVFNVCNALSPENLINAAKNSALEKGCAYAKSPQKVRIKSQEAPEKQETYSTTLDTPRAPVSQDDADTTGHEGAVGHPLALPPITYITQRGELEDVLPLLCATPALAMDTETTGLDPLQDRLRLISVALPDRVVLVDCTTVPVPLLAPVLHSPGTLVFHNAKFDLKFLRAAGLPWPAQRTMFDSMLAAQLIGAGSEAELEPGYWTSGGI